MPDTQRPRAAPLAWCVVAAVVLAAWGAAASETDTGVMSTDGLPDQPCRDAAICMPHARSVFEEDWADVLADMGPLMPGLRSPCFHAPASGATRCLPAFLLAGFPKCGTTTVFGKLSMHPLFERSSLKEPHWWTRSLLGARSFNDYLNYFREPVNIVRSNMLTYEASASTVWDRGQRNPHLRRMLIPEALGHLLPSLKVSLSLSLSLLSLQ